MVSPAGPPVAATILEPVLFGLGPGAIIAALAVGLVVAYRVSGVVNFAHGAVATYVAYTQVSLVGDGSVPLPPLPNPVAPLEGLTGTEIVDLPTRLDLGAPLGTGAALVVSVVVAAVIGLVLHLAVFRPLRDAPPLARVVASVGVMLALQAAVVLRFGSRSVSPEPVFPRDPVTIAGVRMGQDRLWVLATVVALTAALWAVSRYTRLGIATRAVAEDRTAAELAGVDADRCAAVSWVVSCALAGLAGVLVAPITGLSPQLFTVVLVSSLAAALAGAMSSLVVAAVGGVLIGVADQMLARAELDWSWFPDIGLRRVLPLAVVVAIMLLRGEVLPSRGAAAPDPLPRAPAAPLTAWRAGRWTVVAVAAAVAAVWAPFDVRSALQTSAVGVVLALSVVVVTGLLGQISLMQMALAGLAAFAVGSLGVDAGVPFPASAALAVLVGVAFGVAAAVPALRIRGMGLAVATLAAGVAIDEVFFRRTGWLGLERSTRRVDPPELFGVEFGPNSSFVAGDGSLPTGGFGLFSLGVAVVACLYVWRLRRSTLGLQMLAVRANERAAAASGVNVVAVKLSGFAAGALLAATGGVLLAYQLGTYGPSSFEFSVSLVVVAVAYLGGIATVAGAVTAGTLVPDGLGAVLAERLVVDVGRYTVYVTGLLVVLTAVVHPAGLDGMQRQGLRRLAATVRSARGGGRRG